MSKHTPGPWECKAEECDKPYIRIRGTALGCRYKIANVLTPIYDGVKSKEAEETRTNAMLIAAAPELLEALEEMLHSFMCTQNPNDYPSDAPCNKARAAIAKAKGEKE